MSSMIIDEKKQWKTKCARQMLPLFVYQYILSDFFQGRVIL